MDNPQGRRNSCYINTQKLSPKWVKLSTEIVDNFLCVKKIALFVAEVAGIIGFALVDCERTFSTVLWKTNLTLDNFQKKCGSENK